jgi:outer membrane protein assembly factor BamB
MRSVLAIALLALAMIGCDDRTSSQLVFGPTAGYGAVRQILRAPLVSPLSSLHTPAIDENRVYVDHAGGPIRALDRNTGAEVWSAERTYGAPAALVVHDGRVLYANAFAVALDAEHGTEHWRVELDDDASLGVPAVADTAFVVGAEQWLYALDVRDGSELWRREIGAGFAHRGVVRGVTAAGDRLYVTMEEFLDVNGAGARAHLVAVRVADGEVLWRFVDDHQWGKRGATFEPAVDADVVIVGDTHGHEYVVVDRAAGTLRYRIPNFDSYWTGPLEAPTIHGDTAFGGSGDGRVTAWRVSTGDIVWRTEAGGTISSIVPCGGVILAQDLSSTILGRRDGRFLRRAFHKKPSEPGLLVTRWVRHGGDVYVGGTHELFGFRCAG